MQKKWVVNGCFYNNDINKLKEMLGKRPDELEGETLKLFESIMKIADERDELIQENKTLRENISKEHTLGYSQGVYDCSESWKETIREKKEEYKKLLMSCNRFSDVDRIKAINERILAYEELLEEQVRKM